jgi:hypothetical protein
MAFSVITKTKKIWNKKFLKCRNSHFVENNVLLTRFSICKKHHFLHKTVFNEDFYDPNGNLLYLQCCYYCLQYLIKQEYIFKQELNSFKFFRL